MNQLIWILLVFVSGIFLPIQAGMNTRLGKAAGNPVYAAMLSFVVGTIGLIMYILITRQSISLSGIRDAPGYVWFGGIVGAFYVTVTILAFPRLGPGVTFGLIVAGQMIMSVVLEHNNILVAQPNPINAMKILGIVLIIAGVVIIRKY